MTKKRYYLEDFKDFTRITLRLYDNKIEHKHYDWLTDCNKIVDLLNELADENEQLKTQLQNTSDQRDEFHRGARENANRVGKIEKENEQLKKELKYFCNIITLTKAIELLDTIYDKYLYASPSDTIAEAKRKGIKECMDTLENYLEDLDA